MSSDHPCSADHGFVGREAQLASLRQLEPGGAVRLVTLVGLGGSGKTTLACQFAKSFKLQYFNNVKIVPLAHARSREDLLRAVATAVELALLDASPDQQLRWALAGMGPGLLVLDGFETVAEHAEATLGTWVPAAPELRFLVTSRVRLGVEGEHVLEVGPMTDADALELFVSRSGLGAVQGAGRARAAQIVAALDRLPLAIELAAARVRATPPHARADALFADDGLLEPGEAGPAAALSALIERSWERLPPWGRLALAQASVFCGGFTLEMAEQVLDLGEEADGPWALDALQTLVDHSLLVAQPVEEALRFHLLDTVAAFAEERMATPDERLGPDAPGGPAALRALRRRHAETFAALGARAALRALDGPGGVKRRKDLLRERDNLSTALSFALAEGLAETAGRLALALAEITTLRGPMAQGLDSITAALALDGLEPDTRAELLIYRARLRYTAGHGAAALGDAEEGARLALSVGAPDLGAMAATLRGLYLRELGQVEAAVRAGEQAVQLAEQSGDASVASYAHGSLGITAFVLGDLLRATQCLEEGLRLARAAGDRRREAAWLGFLGGMANDQCEYEGGQALMEEAIRVLREVGDRQNTMFNLGNLGTLLRSMGLLDASLTQTREALRLAYQLGARRSVGIWECNLGIVYHRRDELDLALHHLRRGVSLLEAANAPRLTGIMLGYLGELQLELGDAEAAATLVRCVEICDSFRSPAGASFRASLAELRADEGQIDEARRLLAEGEAVLRGSWPPELATLLLRRVRVETRASRPDVARAALDEAKKIAEDLRLPEQSELRVAIRRAERRSAEAPRAG